MDLGYKTLDLANAIEERRKRALIQVKKEISNEDLPEEDFMSQTPVEPPKFHIKSYLERVNTTLERIINFDKNQLSYLKKLIINAYGRKKRNLGIGTKSRIFIALFAFATNQTYPEMSASLGIRHSTIGEIVAECTLRYFPVWAKAFMLCFQQNTFTQHDQKVRFQHFPWCVGAVDTTTIAFLRPTDKQEQRLSFKLNVITKKYSTI